MRHPVSGTPLASILERHQIIDCTCIHDIPPASASRLIQMLIEKQVHCVVTLESIVFNVFRILFQKSDEYAYNILLDTTN